MSPDSDRMVNSGIVRLAWLKIVQGFLYSQLHDMMPKHHKADMFLFSFYSIFLLRARFSVNYPGYVHVDTQAECVVVQIMLKNQSNQSIDLYLW